MSAPGHLVKRTLTPKPETLTVEGDRLTIESAARKERRTLRLQDYPVLWAFVESIRSTLSGDIGALERFYRVELEGRPRALAPLPDAARSRHARGHQPDQYRRQPRPA